MLVVRKNGGMVVRCIIISGYHLAGFVHKMEPVFQSGPSLQILHELEDRPFDEEEPARTIPSEELNSKRSIFL
jgi:hypothetical protein